MNSPKAGCRGVILGTQLLTLLGVSAVACQTAAESLAVQRAEALESTPAREGLNDLGRALAGLSCSKMFTCCSTIEIADRLHAVVSDVQGCEQALEPRYTAYVQRITQSSMAGRVAYHGDRAKRCLATLQTQSCTDYALQRFRGPPPGSDCDAWLEPLVKNGGACSEDDECVSGYCRGRQVGADGTLADGTCAALPALGQPCESACVAGAFCDTTTDPPQCLPAQGAGAACTEADQCQSNICDGSPAKTLCQAAPTSCLGR